MGRITSVRPLWAIEGGRVTLDGDDFPIDPVVPHVRLGTQPARLAAASSSALTLIVPEGLDGGPTSVRIDELPGETAFVEIGTPLTSGAAISTNAVSPGSSSTRTGVDPPSRPAGTMTLSVVEEAAAMRAG